MLMFMKCQCKCGSQTPGVLHALSYLEESVVPMHTVLPSELLGSMRTSFEPSANTNDPVAFFASGASSETSSLRVKSSPEAMIPVAWPQHSTSHS